jgi:hypothetical protein
MLNTIHYVDSYTSLICLIVPCFVVLQKLHGKVARFRFRFRYNRGYSIK